MTQEQALDILKMGKNVYLTGSAGSGKTYILNKYIEYLRNDGADPAVTASTGIAASHMNGMTIHSWSGLGIRSVLTEYDLEDMEEKRYLWTRFENAKVLIIDEVSMLHHYRLDLVERIARFFKRNQEPFGGLQVVLCGDFFQLPPVTKKAEPESNFCYLSDSWKSLDLKICYLAESHRQNDDRFLQVLNAIRTNTISSDVRSILEERLGKDTSLPVRATKLYTHNIDVDSINDAELTKMSGEAHYYRMNSHGNPHIVETLKKSCLSPENLSLKKGAQVMFVKNNFEEGYVNGTLGTVVGFDGGYPTVKTLDGRLIEAAPMEWSIEEDGKVKATISQVPLRLAWAITVHKSQGMTLDAAEIDLSKSFEKGMGYVALSRVRSLEGLKLIGLNDLALKIDEDVLLFDEALREQSEKNVLLIKNMDDKQKKEIQNSFLSSIVPKAGKSKEKIKTHIKTKAMIEEKLPLKDIALKRGLTEETIVSHIEKLLESGEKIDIGYIKSTLEPERIEKISEAFKKSFKKRGDYSLAPVKAALGPDFSYDEIRIARLFLDKL